MLHALENLISHQAACPAIGYGFRNSSTGSQSVFQGCRTVQLHQGFGLLLSKPHVQKDLLSKQL